MNATVVCLGVITLDSLALVTSYPGPDQRVEASILEITGGGPAANAASALHRQDVDVTMIGRVGDDLPGRLARELLEGEGVDITGVIVDADAPTQTAVVVVSQEHSTRAISTLAIPALPRLGDMGPEAMSLVRSAGWLHVDHLGYASYAPARIDEGGADWPLVSLDAGNVVHGLDGTDLSLIDLYVPTVESLCAAMGTDERDAAAAEALRRGAKCVVATDGKNGSYAWWSQGFLGWEAGTASAPAAQGVEIVSTLGAGDVFHGGLLSALVRGRDMTQALIEANLTAALSCRALDGRQAVPTLEELNAYLT